MEECPSTASSRYRYRQDRGLCLKASKRWAGGAAARGSSLSVFGQLSFAKIEKGVCDRWLIMGDARTFVLRQGKFMVLNGLVHIASSHPSHHSPAPNHLLTAPDWGTAAAAPARPRPNPPIRHKHPHRHASPPVQRATDRSRRAPFIHPPRPSARPPACAMRSFDVIRPFKIIDTPSVCG